MAVNGYGVYRNNVSVGSTDAVTRSFTFSGLSCGTSYALAVDATDAAGNRSAKTSLTASTSSCPVADTQPPAVPQGLRTTATTQTSATLAWNATTDNVGVTGYRLYRDNFLAGTTPGLTYTFTGLTCGTLYALALEAYDAAGNVSYRPEAVAMVSTNPCSGTTDTQAPTAPTSLASSGITSSAVTVSWAAVDGQRGRHGLRPLQQQLAGQQRHRDELHVQRPDLQHGLHARHRRLRRGRAIAPHGSLNATTSACPPPPPVGSASVFLSPTGSDTNPCSQARPVAPSTAATASPLRVRPSRSPVAPTAARRSTPTPRRPPPTTSSSGPPPARCDVTG